MIFEKSMFPVHGSRGFRQRKLRFAIDFSPQKRYHLTVFTVACAKSPLDLFDF
jgi:hypothetical protein